MDHNQPPVIEKNIGLDYLYQIDGHPGRLITKNELMIVDKDDPDSDLVIEVTRKPAYGFIEHKDRPGVQLFRFTQHDINSNKIYYVLRHLDDRIGVYEDYFEFDVHDSASTTGSGLRQNRFGYVFVFVECDNCHFQLWFYTFVNICCFILF